MPVTTRAMDNRFEQLAALIKAGQQELMQKFEEKLEAGQQELMQKVVQVN